MQLRKPDGSNTIGQADASGNLIVSGPSGGLAVKSSLGTSFTVSVAANGSLSAGLDLDAVRAGRFGMPADIGTATVMTFQTSVDGVTWRDLYDAGGSEYSIKVAANRAVVPDLTMFAAAEWIKVRFGTAASPNTYANQRDINVACLP